MEFYLIIVLSLFAVDFLFIGIVLRVLGALNILKTVKPIKRSDLKKKYIEDSLFPSHSTNTIKTNLKDRPIDPKKERFTIKSILLTHDYLIIRRTYLTCLLKIRMDLITSYKTTKKMIGTEVKLNIIDEKEMAYFTFRTKKINQWIEAFEKINIKRDRE